MQSQQINSLLQRETKKPEIDPMSLKKVEHNVQVAPESHKYRGSMDLARAEGNDVEEYQLLKSEFQRGKRCAETGQPTNIQVNHTGLFRNKPILSAYCEFRRGKKFEEIFGE